MGKKKAIMVNVRKYNQYNILRTESVTHTMRVSVNMCCTTSTAIVYSYRARTGRRGLTMPRIGGTYGYSLSFCTRQFNNSATYNSFSDGHAIWWIHPNCFGSFPASPIVPSTRPSSVSL